MYTILGFNCFKSRKGEDCVTMQVARDFNDFEKKAGSFGSRVEAPFLPSEFFNLVDAKNIGKKVNIYYNQNGYVAYVKVEE